ncbi:phytanoyl-CoA dioxygenase family protein [Microvirga calopogonii]|uniref:phytanoyl-CoA dioxygenase family protein n=1 Tax=Microvirga calopogonii TaxID=2078013 RepID=UPI000E0D6BAB|nr:phytanoyl-CoA dioxygenase family protein [Microvirga calopogonii]
MRAQRDVRLFWAAVRACDMDEQMDRCANLTPPVPPLRAISAAEIARFNADGVVCLRGLFQVRWVEALARFVEQIARDPAQLRGAAVPPTTFLGDSFLWKTFDECRDFAYGSPAAHIAQQLLGSQRINLLFDQLFVKPAGCAVATPWHHDHTFWPLSGTQIMTIWMALGDIKSDNSALEFVRGSHRWGKRYKAVRPDRLAYLLESALDDPPDVEARRSDYDIVSWDMEPGDVLAFDAFVLHGSPANHSIVSRHAFATRWAGDDVRFAPGPATMPLNWRHGLRPGSPLGGPLFPQILPRPLAHELGSRAYGPEPRDPELLAATRRLYQEAELRQRKGSDAKQAPVGADGSRFRGEAPASDE